MKKKVEKKPFLSTPMLVVITTVIIVLLAVVLNPKSYEFNSIGATEFKELYNAKSESIVYIGSATCSYCTKFSPVLKKVAKKYELEVNYIDISTLDENSGKEFYAVDKFFTEEQWGTPLVVIAGNGKMSDKKLNGYTEEADTVSYFKSVGMIK